MHRRLDENANHAAVAPCGRALISGRELQETHSSQVVRAMHTHAGSVHFMEEWTPSLYSTGNEQAWLGERKYIS